MPVRVLRGGGGAHRYCVRVYRKRYAIVGLAVGVLSGIDRTAVHEVYALKHVRQMIGVEQRGRPATVVPEIDHFVQPADEERHRVVGLVQ